MKICSCSISFIKILADRLADDIAKRIEGEMEYPGQIKVTVIRERRSVSLAK